MSYFYRNPDGLSELNSQSRDIPEGSVAANQLEYVEPVSPGGSQNYLAVQIAGEFPGLEMPQSPPFGGIPFAGAWVNRGQ